MVSHHRCLQPGSDVGYWAQKGDSGAIPCRNVPWSDCSCTGQTSQYQDHPEMDSRPCRDTWERTSQRGGQTGSQGAIECTEKAASGRREQFATQPVSSMSGPQEEG